MTDMHVGRVFRSAGGWAKYRCVAKDRDGCYIMRSVLAPGRCIVVTELELMTGWRAIR